MGYRGRGKVVVAYLQPGELSTTFHLSLINLFIADLQGSQRILVGGGHVVEWCGTNELAKGRNRVAEKFLDEHDAEWLFMVDADMGFGADVVDRLIASASKERPVVGALCYAHRMSAMDPVTNSPVYTEYPTCYRYLEHDGQPWFVPFTEVKGELERVAATGAACLLIRRSVLEEIREKHGDNWFTRITSKDDPYGEDMSFCLRVQSVGRPVFVDTSLRTSHHKPTYLGAVVTDEQVRAQAESNPLMIQVDGEGGDADDDHERVHDARVDQDVLEAFNGR